VSAVSRSRKKLPDPEIQSADICTEARRADAAPSQVLSERLADPDLVDRIFDYIVEQLPEIAGRHLEIKRAIREEFGSARVYVRRRNPGEKSQLALEVARLFNGRNATEVARELQISRGTVYRLLKQPGRS